MGLQGPEGPYLWPLAGPPMIICVRVWVSLSRKATTLASDDPGVGEGRGYLVYKGHNFSYLLGIECSWLTSMC